MTNPTAQDSSSVVLNVRTASLGEEHEKYYSRKWLSKWGISRAACLSLGQLASSSLASSKLSLMLRGTVDFIGMLSNGSVSTWQIGNKKRGGEISYMFSEAYARSHFEVLL